jgi:outer membrane protein OmpA-like peptidoglycan-associated protein
MAHWRRWLRNGVLATGLIALLAFFVHSGAIERELTASVSDRLAGQGQGWATVAVAGRDVVVGGTAPSTDAVASALALAESVDGVRAVSDATGLLPIASPYVWSVRKAGRVVTMQGNVPSESFRNSVLAGARRALPDAEIRDEMTLARGASNGFNAGTNFALVRLAALAEGTVTLTDGMLSVTGIASNAASYSDARAALREQMPSAVALGPVDILPARADPFVWSANYDGNSLTFSGFVPNEIVHETLAATARATLPRAAIVDRSEVASGEPKGFAEAASFAIGTLGRLSEGGVTLDGLTLDIAGTPRTVDDYEAVLDGLAGGLPAGMKVVSNAIKPAPVSPYGWQGEKDGAAVILSGYVPSPDGHAEVAAAAKAAFAGMTITDKIRVASGEPKMDWIGGIKFAMAELAKLGRGSVTLGDRTFAIEGEAATAEAFADLAAVNDATLPASLALVKAALVPPRVSPYRFVAMLGAKQLSLSGYAPSPKDRQTILDTARRKFGSDEIVDKLVYASGAPDDFVPAVAVALQAVARLGGGTAELDDDSVKINGAAFSPRAGDEIASAAAEAFPKTFKAVTTIVVRQEGQPLTAAGCRDRLQVELQRGSVEFEPSKAEIAADSFGLLDRIAATLARCTEAQVEVAAHTDSGGSTSKNRDLTQARAEAIVDYLVDAGVKRERLNPVGYGETKPIADNATAAGKSANRRIEFTVALPEGG